MGEVSPAIKVKAVEYRDRSTDELVELLIKELEDSPDSPLWWTARRPKKRWHLGLSKRQALVFNSAPQFEQILWLPAGSVHAPPSHVTEEASSLLNDYKALFEGSEEVEGCPYWQKYSSTLSSHIKRQQESDYPDLLNNLSAERTVRELGYEHQGLERGLEELPALLRLARIGQLDRKMRSKADLDFYHLLEHHLERELEAIYPALSYLDEVASGVDR